MRRAAAAALLPPLPPVAAAGLIVVGTALAAACQLLAGDPDRIIALEIIGPVTYTVPVNDTLQLRARARSADGDTVAGAVITWAVLDTGEVGIAVDAATGRVIAEAEGSWRVQARVEDIRSDPITITVTAPAAALRPSDRSGPAQTHD